MKSKMEIDKQEKKASSSKMAIYKKGYQNLINQEILFSHQN